MATTPTTPSAPATPSADVAAANWDKSAPATPATPAPGSPSAPAAAAPGTPAAPATPAAAEPAAPEVNDGLTDLLKDDLTLAAPDAAAADPLADPLEALKDNPRVQELLQHETTVKGLLTKSEYIKEAAHIEDAIADADVLWKIIDGKEHPKAILEALKVSNPQAHPAVLQQLREYIEQETGQPLAAPPAGQPATQPLTPDQQRLAAVEKELNLRKEAEASAAFNRRIETTKTAVTSRINDQLKGTWLEGEGEYVLELIGAKLAQKVGVDRATRDMVDAAEKSDFKLLEKTLREIRNEEAQRLDARIKRLNAMKQKKAATIPVQASGNVPASNEPTPPAAITDDEKRKEAMLKAYRSTT
jgi:hypothetical protein